MTRKEKRLWLKGVNKTYHYCEIILVDLDYVAAWTDRRSRRVHRKVQAKAADFLGKRRNYVVKVDKRMADVITKSKVRAKALFRAVGLKVKLKDIQRERPFASLLTARRLNLEPGRVHIIETRR